MTQKSTCPIKWQNSNLQNVNSHVRWRRGFTVLLRAGQKKPKEDQSCSSSGAECREKKGCSDGELKLGGWEGRERVAERREQVPFPFSRIVMSRVGIN